MDCKSNVLVMKLWVGGEVEVEDGKQADPRTDTRKIKSGYKIRSEDWSKRVKYFVTGGTCQVKTLIMVTQGICAKVILLRRWQWLSWMFKHWDSMPRSTLFLMLSDILQQTGDRSHSSRPNWWRRGQITKPVTFGGSAQAVKSDIEHSCSDWLSEQIDGSQNMVSDRGRWYLLIERSRNPSNSFSPHHVVGCNARAVTGSGVGLLIDLWRTMYGSRIRFEMDRVAGTWVHCNFLFYTKCIELLDLCTAGVSFKYGSRTWYLGNVVSYLGPCKSLSTPLCEDEAMQNHDTHPIIHAMQNGPSTVLVSSKGYRTFLGWVQLPLNALHNSTTYILSRRQFRTLTLLKILVLLLVQ